MLGPVFAAATCSPFDLGCNVNSAVSNQVQAMAVDMVQAMANFMADTLYNTFASSVGNGGFTAAFSVANTLLVIGVVVLVIALIYSVVRAATRFSMKGIIRAIVLTATAVAFMRVSGWFVPQVTKFFDDMTLGLLQSWAFSPDGVTANIMQLFGMIPDPASKAGHTTYMWPDNTFTPPSWMPISSSEAGGTVGVGVVITTGIAVVLMMICSVILSLVLAFRDYGIVVLTALIPIAYMLLPIEKGAAIARNWAIAVLTLLAAKPLAAIIIEVGVKMLGDNHTVAGYFVSIIALFIASFSPVVAFGFFKWLQVEGGHAYAQAAGEGRLGSIPSSLQRGVQTMQSGADSVRRMRSPAPAAATSGGGGGAAASSASGAAGAGASSGAAAGGATAGAGAGAAGGATAGAAAAGGAAGTVGGPAGTAAGAAAGIAASAALSGVSKVASAGVEKVGDAASGMTPPPSPSVAVSEMESPAAAPAHVPRAEIQAPPPRTTPIAPATQSPWEKWNNQ